MLLKRSFEQLFVVWDRWFSERKIAEGKIVFKKPVKRTTGADDKEEVKEKKKKEEFKQPDSRLLSFGDDEEEDEWLLTACHGSDPFVSLLQWSVHACAVVLCFVMRNSIFFRASSNPSCSIFHLRWKYRDGLQRFVGLRASLYSVVRWKLYWNGPKLAAPSRTNPFVPLRVIFYDEYFLVSSLFFGMLRSLLFFVLVHGLNCQCNPYQLLTSAAGQPCTFHLRNLRQAFRFSFLCTSHERDKVLC